MKFRCIQQLWRRNHEMLARLELPAELVPESQRNAVHPALLDACLHVVFADVHRTGDPDRIFLPYRIDRVRFYRRLTQNIWADVRVTRDDDEYLCSDTLIFDEAGELVAVVLGLTCKRLAGAGSRQADTLYEGGYEYQWTPAPRQLEFHRRIFDYTRAVLIADAAGLASELAVRLAADGIEPRVIRFNPRDSFDALLADVALDRRTLIVFAAGLKTNVERRTGTLARRMPDDGQECPSYTGLAHCPHVPALLQLVQTLLKRQGVPRLCVVTNGAAGVAGDQQLDLGQAILHGMGRVINNECPNVPLTVIDLSESVTSGEVDALYHELLHSRLDRDETEIALRGEQRFVRQLVSVDREGAEQAAVSEEPGVGGAAIQLAQRAGAIVIATAGTKDKGAYLRSLGVEHVFDSRSLDFSNQVMEVTSGRGVDIVLNSLTSRFITQSLKCLAPFGRFIELGKSDIYRNSKLSLERLGENISYFVVDVDRLAAQKPELHRQILTEVVALFERGELQPLEITEFPISKLPEAMKFMTRAAYRGKIVLNMQNDRVRTLPPRSATFRSDRCYLISGGASGFGLEIARWMAGRGARHLVLLSRSGPKSDVDLAALETIKAQGARVLHFQADVSDRVAIDRLMELIKREMPPLAGVVHGAAVLDDASIPTLDMARFERVFNPKAQGAWNLHEATLSAGASLDFFLMLSSISSVLGLVGQANYAAANFFQDALAQYRRERGLTAATSINLGVLGQYAGMSKAENDVQEELRESEPAEEYRNLVDERRQLQPYRDRRVLVAARFSRSEAVFVVRDDGIGFNTAQLPDPTDPANLGKSSGRGLFLIRTFMDEVSFNESGNEITMVKRCH